MYFLVRPLLFLFPPETMHRFVFFCLKCFFSLPGVKLLVRTIYRVQNECLVRHVAGIRFPNPLGLAAGFDKNAFLLDELSCFGFGFIEIGTITPKPQPGNPRPRLFRLKKDRALINRMGFNNIGAKRAAQRLSRRKSKVIVGANIGKNKNTPLDEAYRDYACCFTVLADVVDFFIVNVSSPNTPGLRDLQQKQPLKKILNTLQNLNEKRRRPKPVFLKIAPDLPPASLDDIAGVVREASIAGIILSNTTIGREGLKSDPALVSRCGQGGLSGAPLAKKSSEMLDFFSGKLKPGQAIIGVGGIMNPQDARQRIEKGAELIQIFTGFIYEGPDLVKRILKELKHLPH